MIITTARKPSPKTRTFCKNLARFTGCEYITRGKTGISEFGKVPLLVVGDHKGNPGTFNFFLNGDCILSIRADVFLDKEIKPGQVPVIVGSSPLAFALNRITGFNIDSPSERFIRVNDSIEFVDGTETCIRLKVSGIRGEGFG